MELRKAGLAALAVLGLRDPSQWWLRCSESGQVPSPDISSRSVSGRRQSGVTVGSPQ